MFVILHNALKAIDDYPTSTGIKTLPSFNDADQVEVGTRKTLSELVGSGIVADSNNYLDPTSNTTRAEIAQVLYNLLSK